MIFCITACSVVCIQSRRRDQAATKTAITAAHVAAESQFKALHNKISQLETDLAREKARCKAHEEDNEATSKEYVSIETTLLESHAIDQAVKKDREQARKERAYLDTRERRVGHDERSVRMWRFSLERQTADLELARARVVSETYRHRGEKAVLAYERMRLHEISHAEISTAFWGDAVLVEHADFKCERNWRESIERVAMSCHPAMEDAVDVSDGSDDGVWMDTPASDSSDEDALNMN